MHADVSSVTWRKASRTYQEGACVEVSDLTTTIGVRDSKDPDGPVLQFGRGAVRQLADRIRGGELDL